MKLKFFLRMNNLSHVFIYLLPIIICLFVTVHSTETDKCYLNSKTVSEEGKLLKRISTLYGQTFRTEKDGFNYVVAICSDTSNLHGNVSATKSKTKGDTIVLGRRNETRIMGGDTWVLLKYENGDKCPNSTETQCLGHHSASIYIVCDPETHDEVPNIRLTEDNGCHYKFVLPSIIICKHEGESLGSTIFIILFSLAFFMYFIVGIVYRRFAYNAQGCQQLPHFSFWHKIGALLADGCNYMCRCDTEAEDSWNNITSNFDSGDRDDVLLRP